MPHLPQKIATLDDVSAFAKHLKNELGLGFHPDEKFDNYINREAGDNTYTAVEAQLRNELLAQAFEVCEIEDVSIYSHMGRIIVKGTPLEGSFG